MEPRRRVKMSVRRNAMHRIGAEISISDAVAGQSVADAQSGDTDT